MIEARKLTQQRTRAGELACRHPCYTVTQLYIVMIEWRESKLSECLKTKLELDCQ